MLKRLIVVFIIALVLTAGCTDQVAHSSFPVATDFSLQDMRGKSVRLSDNQGKVVLLEFWATWCPPCREAVPGLEKLHKAYKDKGVVVLAVSMDLGGWDELESYINEQGITYKVLKGTEAVAAQYQVRTIPVMLVLNKEGRIVKRYLGMDGDKDLEKDIKAYL